MKNLLVVLLTVFTITAYAGDGSNKLAIGDKAVFTDVDMLAVSGESLSIENVAKENGVLVLFSANTCPIVLQWEDRYPSVKEWAENNNVGMIVVNSNYQSRDGVDSFEEMKERASAQGYNFHYAVDSESKLANAFGAQTTPHAFLFNADMELVYKGAIDDNYASADQVSKTYLKDAMTSLASGQEIAVSETQPVGCSIKRKVVAEASDATTME